MQKLYYDGIWQPWPLAYLRWLRDFPLSPTLILIAVIAILLLFTAYLAYISPPC
jgi:hypothetical protein